jgi:hypothetical protein
MRRFAVVLAGLLVPAFLLAGAVANSAMAQQKAAKAAATQKVLVENDKMRVYEVTYKPGAENTSVPSSSSRVVRALKGGTIQRIYKAGQVRLNEPGPGYTAKNIGKTAIVLYVVQVK